MGFKMTDVCRELTCGGLRQSSPTGKFQHGFGFDRTPNMSGIHPVSRRRGAHNAWNGAPKSSAATDSGESPGFEKTDWLCGGETIVENGSERRNTDDRNSCF